MNLKCTTFLQMAEDIKNNKKEIVMFGAGVIGQVSAPEILAECNLLKNIKCYIDNSSKMWGTQIEIKGYFYDTKSPAILNECGSNTVILINISRFAEVIEQLEDMDATADMDVYIMPMMLIHNMCLKPSAGSPIMSDKMLIPKVIHYMWFGRKPIPDTLRRCMDTWREFCPDYEIVEWNEDNYDVNKHPYMAQAYEQGAYGFVPDYARLDILYNHGGIYFDTDVQLIKNIDQLLYQEAFSGVEKWQVLTLGCGTGAVKGHRMIKKLLDLREKISFIDKKGNINKNTCGFYDTRVILDEGYKMNGTTQCVGGMNIYAYDYFQPMDYMSGQLNVTENTYAIHNYNGGWMDESMKKQNEVTAQRYKKLYDLAQEDAGK